MSRSLLAALVCILGLNLASLAQNPYPVRSSGYQTRGDLLQLDARLIHDPKKFTVVLNEDNRSGQLARAILNTQDPLQRKQLEEKLTAAVRTDYSGTLEAINIQEDGVTVILRREPSVRVLLDAWKSTEDSAEKSQLEKDLRSTLGVEFQSQLERQEEELTELEARVEKLRQQLEMRRAKQDEIIDFRMQQLLREAQGLGWGNSTGGEPKRNPFYAR